jgi:hypothetical protein
VSCDPPVSSLQACVCSSSDTCSCASSGYSTGSGRSSNSSQNGEFSASSSLSSARLPNESESIGNDVSFGVKDRRLKRDPKPIGTDPDNPTNEVKPVSGSDDDSSSDDDDEEQFEEHGLDSSNWTVGTLLDLPAWKDLLQPLCFHSIESFEEFESMLQQILQEQMQRYQYNTFSSFVFFCRQFAAAQLLQPDLQLDHFFASFTARLLPDALSCVGLSMILLKQLRGRLGDKYPALSSALGPVSCEEFVKDVGSYTLHSANTLKEHVLLAICIQIDGRPGYVLLDPGYHVAKPVVVMQDNLHPHTAWFVHGRPAASQKSFCYKLVANQLVTWTVRESVANGEQQTSNKREYSNLIHAKQLFANSVDICEKRSYLYSFKSYVIRDTTGSIAGFYCYLRTRLVTFFYPDERTGQRVQKKYAVDQLLNDEMQADVHRVAKHVPNQPNEAIRLLNILAEFQEVLTDNSLVNQIMAIDRWIEEEL